MTSISKPSEQEVITYWQLVLKISDDQNPINDANGTTALRGQNGSNKIIYLSGNNATKHSRKIPQKIPSGRCIFLAVNPVEVSQPEAKPNDTIPELQKFANDDENTATRANLTINGQVNDLIKLKYRVPTKGFRVTLPPNALFGAKPPGEYDAAADGFYAITEELAEGKYNIVIDAEVAKPFKQSAPWTSNVTYDFEVV